MSPAQAALAAQCPAQHDPRSPQYLWALNEAALYALEGIVMAVGWQVTDGEPEYGFCPLSAVGPATVVKVIQVIKPNRLDEEGS